MVKLSDEMATGEHTPEPWHWRRGASPSDGEYDYGIGAAINEHNHCIAETFGRVDTNVRPDAEANARRIVACVNACRGIETADLVQDVPPDSPAGIARKAVKRADAAEGALKKISRGRPDNGRPLGGEFTRQLARKVLTDAGVGWALKMEPGDEGEG